MAKAEDWVEETGVVVKGVVGKEEMAEGKVGAETVVGERAGTWWREGGGGEGGGGDGGGEGGGDGGGGDGGGGEGGGLGGGGLGGGEKVAD